MESSNTHLVRASSSSSSSSSSTPSSRLSSSSSSQGGSVPPATLTPPPPRRPDWWSTAIATGDHHHGDDSAGDGSPNQKQQPNDHITTGNDGDGGDSSSDWDWVDDPDDPLSSSKEPPLPAGLPLVEVALDPLEHPATDISTIASKEQSTETAATVILVVKNESNKDVNSRRPDNTWNANPSTAEMTSPPVPSTQSTPTAPVVTNNTSTFLDPEPTLSIGGGSTTGTSGSGNSDDDAEYSTFDDDVLDEFPMVMDKPLQTLEKLQHMLDETDYLTTSRTTSQPFGSSTKLSPPSASTFVPPPNAAMENGKDDTSSNNASSSENTLPAVAESLWTSKDRSKYKRQQRNARAASESVVGSSGTTGSTNPASAGSSVSRSGTTATTVGSLPPPFAATTSTTSIQQQPPQLQPQSRQRQPPPPLPSTTTTAATSTANPRRQIFSPSWPRSSQTMSSLDAAVVSSSDGIEDQSDTDDGLGYTLPNLPVYLSDDEGDYFSEATTTTTASGFSEEDAAMAAAARAAAAAANYAQLQRWNPPVYPQQQQQQPQQQGPSMMYPGYPYSTSGPPQWTTATPPHQQYGYYPPPQAIHSQQQYYLPPQAQGTYPPPASLSPPPGYFYPQQYLPPTPSLNSMYASQRIHKGESSSMHYNDPKLLPLEDPFSSSPYDMVPSSSMSVERPPMNNNGVYHHPRHPILQLQSPLVPPLEDWQYAPTPVLLGHFWRALGSLTQIATCLILSTLVCYAAVSPRNLPFLEYNQKFYEILKIASLAWIPPVVVSSLVVDRASNRLSCLVNGFFSAFTMGYVGTFVLEIVAATITRLAVFAAWEPNVFDMTPQVPLITIPWVLRDQKYLVKPITLIVQDLVTSVAVCPVVEEWMKLVIFKAVIPRGRYETFAGELASWETLVTSFFLRKTHRKEPPVALHVVSSYPIL